MSSEGGLVLVTIEVTLGREDDYRRWHDVHIAEVAAHLPSVTDARRYELEDPGVLDSAFPTARFVAAYELSDTPSRFRSELAVARERGQISPPPDGVVSNALTLSYTAV